MFRISWLCLLIGGSLFLSCNRPIAKFSFDGEKMAPSTFTFSNESEKAEQYRWDFGDGAISEEANPNHRFLNSGNYAVQLTAIRGDKERTTTKNIQIAPPELCLAEIETPMGNILIQLFDATPNHQENFLKLADQGYFDSLLFHRVMNGFMIQGGDPQSRNAPPNQQLGMGGPGYQVDAEFVDTLFHFKGALAAARSPDHVNPEKKSSGSQFYIVQGRVPNEAQMDRFEAENGFRYPSDVRNQYLEVGGTPFLDQQYTIFGQVVDGLEVVDKIAAVSTNRANRPNEDVWMTIRIIR